LQTPPASEIFDILVTGLARAATEGDFKGAAERMADVFRKALMIEEPGHEIVPVVIGLCMAFTAEILQAAKTVEGAADETRA
jgi:hypothetical protein